MANPTGAKGGEHVTDKARDAMRTVGEQASRVASTVGEKADQAAQSAGSGLRNLGEQLRENAPREGMLGSAAQYTASGLEQTGRYIEEQGFSGMMGDLTEVVRRNPWPAVFVGLGIGFLLGRALRR